MSRGAAGSSWKPLELKGNGCDMMRQGKGLGFPAKPLILLVQTEGLEPSREIFQWIYHPFDEQGTRIFAGNGDQWNYRLSCAERSTTR